MGLRRGGQLLITDRRFRLEAGKAAGSPRCLSPLTGRLATAEAVIYDAHGEGLR